MIALCTCNSLAFTRKSIGHISANRKFRHSPFGTENIRRKHSLILSTLEQVSILTFSQLSLSCSLVLGFSATLKHCTCRHDKTSEHCTCSHDKKLLHSLYARQNSMCYMCSQNMQCIHSGSPMQSLGVDFSPTASREAVCAVGTFWDAHEGG